MPHRKDPATRTMGEILSETPWLVKMPAFRVFGNLYFVGNRDGASWLVDTGEGLILFDSNYPTTDALLIDSIWSVGFNPRQITDIIHTHGHYDHFGATDLLHHLSGARTWLGEKDIQMFKERPELTFSDHIQHAYQELFDADVSVKDGDEFTIGRTHLRAVATPGHCPGATTWFFDVTDGSRTLTACLHGGAGLNTIMKDYRQKYQVDWRQDFLNSIDRLMPEKADIFLGNHSMVCHVREKLARMRKGDMEAFIDPEELQRYLTGLRQSVVELMAREGD